MIVADWLHLRARRSPAAPALVAPDGQLVTYGTLEARVALLERRLRGAGLGRGDRVLALLPSGTALVELLHAAARAGVVLAPLDPRSTGDEARFAARRACARGSCSARAASAMAVAAAAESCAARQASGAPDGVPLADVGPPPRRRCGGIDLDAAHTIVFTSGTTGRPRGVVLSAGNHLASARASAARLGVAADDRWLACLPLHHVGGLAVLLRAVLAGGAVVLQRGFAPDAVLRALRDGRRHPAVAGADGAAPAARRSPTAPPAALRVLLLGGAAPTSSWCATRARAAGPSRRPTA